MELKSISRRYELRRFLRNELVWEHKYLAFKAAFLISILIFTEITTHRQCLPLYKCCLW
jgi:hypothetical protein